MHETGNEACGKFMGLTAIGNEGFFSKSRRFTRATYISKVAFLKKKTSLLLVLLRFERIKNAFRQF